MDALEHLIESLDEQITEVEADAPAKSLTDDEVETLDAVQGAARRKVVEHMAQRVKYHSQRIKSGLAPMPEVDLLQPEAPDGSPTPKKPGGPKLH